MVGYLSFMLPSSSKFHVKLSSWTWLTLSQNSNLSTGCPTFQSGLSSLANQLLIDRWCFLTVHKKLSSHRIVMSLGLSYTFFFLCEIKFLLFSTSLGLSLGWDVGLCPIFCAPTEMTIWLLSLWLFVYVLYFIYWIAYVQLSLHSYN